MDNLRLIIAKNITELRTSMKLTQLELGEKLCYSDKAISKWERGESMPDITVLKEIADMFGVTVDYLLQEEHTTTEAGKPAKKTRYRMHLVITLLSVLLVWIIATFSFAMGGIINNQATGLWLAFIYAVPVSFIVWLVFNSIWFHKKLNYIIISLLMWTIIASIHLTFVALSPNLFRIWLLYFVGIPGQAAIVIWSLMRK